MFAQLDSLNGTREPTRLRKYTDSPVSRLVCSIQGWPSAVMFQLSLFPHNLPLPHARTSARVLAAVAHTLHLCPRQARTARMSQLRLD